MALRLRELAQGERESLDRLARSRKAEARLQERARIIQAAVNGDPIGAIARRRGTGQKTVRLWISRFNAHGIAGLQDAPRSGRPPTYTPEQVGELVALALTQPVALGLPFGCWTLDRLATYIREHRAIRMKRGRINQVLGREGLRWRAEETWFGERVDPQFAEKRGKLSGSGQRRLRAV
jgi:transposase